MSILKSPRVVGVSDVPLGMPEISGPSPPHGAPSPAPTRKSNNGYAPLGFRQLQSFVVIADRGSLSKAALELGLSQSALSDQMLNLERELGSQLLHRSTAGVMLTERGRIFCEHAQAILRQVEEARAAVRQSPCSPIGSVVLGLSSSVAATLAVPLLIRALAAFPRIDLHIAEDPMGDLAEHLRRGKIHLAMLENNGQAPDFICTPLVCDRLYLIEAANNHDATATHDIPLTEALARPLVLPTLHQHGIRQLVLRAATENGSAPPRVVAELNSVHLLTQAVLSGVGATIMPLAPFQSEITHGRLWARKIVEPEITRELTLCAARNVPMTLAAHAISTLAVSVARVLCENDQWSGAERGSQEMSVALERLA